MIQGGSCAALKSGAWKSDGKPSLTDHEVNRKDEKNSQLLIFLKINNYFSKINILPLNDGFSKSRLFGHIIALAKIRSKQHRSK